MFPMAIAADGELVGGRPDEQENDHGREQEGTATGPRDQDQGQQVFPLPLLSGTCIRGGGVYQIQTHPSRGEGVWVDAVQMSICFLCLFKT